MATSVQSKSNFRSSSRQSTDSQARPLFTDSTTSTPVTTRPPSIAPSISSVFSDATTIQAPTHQQRGFSSREAYLAALHEFAESKMYQDTNAHTLHGWYGDKTMDDYMARKSLREKRRERKQKEKLEREQARRRTVPELGNVPEEGGVSVERTVTGQSEQGENTDGGGAHLKEKEGPMRRLSRVLTGGGLRRGTIS